MVSGLTGIVVQPNKAIVGGNAFAHESGIHQDGMLKNRDTYEIMTPDDVGVPNNKNSFRQTFRPAWIKSSLNRIGYTLAEEELKKLYELFIRTWQIRKKKYMMMIYVY